MTEPAGNSKFSFPSVSEVSGNQNSGCSDCFPWGQSLGAYCHTSQLKYVFRLEENMPRVVGQSLTP